LYGDPKELAYCYIVVDKEERGEEQKSAYTWLSFVTAVETSQTSSYPSTSFPLAREGFLVMSQLEVEVMIYSDGGCGERGVVFTVERGVPTPKGGGR